MVPSMAANLLVLGDHETEVVLVQLASTYVVKECPIGNICSVWQILGPPVNARQGELSTAVFGAKAAEAAASAPRILNSRNCWEFKCHHPSLHTH